MSTHNIRFCGEIRHIYLIPALYLTYEYILTPKTCAKTTKKSKMNELFFSVAIRTYLYMFVQNILNVYLY